MKIIILMEKEFAAELIIVKKEGNTTDVKNAYGTPSLEEDWMYMYSFDNDKYSLEFMLIDGTVSEINVVAEVM